MNNNTIVFHRRPSKNICLSPLPKASYLDLYVFRAVAPAANLIVATGHNNLAINRGVLQVARRFVTGPTAPEGAFNRVEAVIRAFDPCLSCSTHALGAMPLRFRLTRPDGTVIVDIGRG